MHQSLQQITCIHMTHTDISNDTIYINKNDSNMKKRGERERERERETLTLRWFIVADYCP